MKLPVNNNTKNKMKLNMSVYLFPLGNCTNGPSATTRDFWTHFKEERHEHTSDAVGYSVTEAKEFATTVPNIDMVIVEDMCCGMRRLRAIPAGLILAGNWTMMGGNYLGTCDSRGFHHLIPIHDRTESGEPPVYSRPPATEKFSYIVSYGGGVGEGVWDRDTIITAVDIQDAANIAKGIAEEVGGWVFGIIQEN